MDCVAFLHWALPRLRLRWPGFRKVRRQVCRRVERRILELGLSGVADYRAYLQAAPCEWAHLDGLCHITISRFYRDRGVFDFLAGTVLPALAADAGMRGAPLEVWSAGCASGEEPYTLALAWHFAVGSAFPGVALHVVATDADETMLHRAREAEYRESALRDLPEPWRESGFTRAGDLYRLRPRFRRPVTFLRHDVRTSPPAASFDLVLCRNLAFTYFDSELQREVAGRLAACIRQGGALVLGRRERLPEGVRGFVPWSATLRVFRRDLGRGDCGARAAGRGSVVPGTPIGARTDAAAAENLDRRARESACSALRLP